MNYKRGSIVAAVLTSVALLAGCATTGGPGTPVAGTNRPSSSGSSTSSTSSAPSDDSSGSGSETVKFGSTYTWDDGLSVTVSKPVKFTPSETSMGGGKNNVKFTVVIVNKSGKTFDPAMFTTTAQSANAEAEEIFDSAKGLEGSPSTKVLNGREVKFSIGYSVTNAKDIVLEVSPSFEHESALFTS